MLVRVGPMSAFPTERIKPIALVPARPTPEEGMTPRNRADYSANVTAASIPAQHGRHTLELRAAPVRHAHAEVAQVDRPRAQPAAEFYTRKQVRL